MAWGRWRSSVWMLCVAVNFRRVTSKKNSSRSAARLNLARLALDEVFEGKSKRRVTHAVQNWVYCTVQVTWFWVEKMHKNYVLSVYEQPMPKIVGDFPHNCWHDNLLANINNDENIVRQPGDNKNHQHRRQYSAGATWPWIWMMGSSGELWKCLS